MSTSVKIEAANPTGAYEYQLFYEGRGDNVVSLSIGLPCPLWVAIIFAGTKGAETRFPEEMDPWMPLRGAFKLHTDNGRRDLQIANLLVSLGGNFLFAQGSVAQNHERRKLELEAIGWGDEETFNPWVGTVQLDTGRTIVVPFSARDPNTQFDQWVLDVWLSHYFLDVGLVTFNRSRVISAMVRKSSVQEHADLLNPERPQ